MYLSEFSRYGFKTKNIYQGILVPSLLLLLKLKFNCNFNFASFFDIKKSQHYINQGKEVKLFFKVTH